MTASHTATLLEGGRPAQRRRRYLKRTTEGSYDWLYVLDGGNAEYLIKACLAGRRSFTRRDTDKLGAVAESGRLQLP